MIRTICESDWESVLEIYRQGILSGISTFTSKCPDYGEWDKNHLKECRFLYEDNGKILGWIALSSTSNRDVYKGVVEISVYVDENYRSKGIGSALIKKVKENAQKYGIWSLFSTVLEVNTPSLKMHEKCGFRKIGYKEKIAKDRFGNWQNTILFEYRF